MRVWVALVLAGAMGCCRAQAEQEPGSGPDLEIGTASLLVPLTSALSSSTGSWHLVFYIAAGMNAVAAVLALAVLKPARLRMAAADAETMRARRPNAT